MSSTISDPAQSFLDHVSCEICYRSVIAEGSASHDVVNGANGSFWICEAFHILCHKEIREGQAHNHESSSAEIHAYCPKCNRDVYMTQLRPDILPAPVQRYLQPFDKSIAELMDAHNFQFTHMSNLISHLKSKLIEQKRLLNHIKQDFERKSNLQRDLDATQRENAALKEEIKVLRSSPLKTEEGSSTSKPQRSGYDMAGANRLRPPPRSTSLQQPQQILQRPSSQASRTRAPFNMTLRDVRPQASRPPTAQSTSGSELFAFKPPPLPFRAREPQVSRLANAESLRMRASASHLNSRVPNNPSMRFVRTLQSPYKQQPSQGINDQQNARPSSRAAMASFRNLRSVPSIARREEQPHQRVQTHSWRSAAASSPASRRNPPQASLASFQRPHAFTGSNETDVQDVTMS